GLLIRIDDGRVDPGFLHRLDRLEFDLLDRWQVEEDGIVWARLPTVFGDELLTLLLQDAGHLGGHRHRLVGPAGIILLPLEPLVVAAVLVLPAAAARTGCVSRELFPWHALRSSDEGLVPGTGDRPGHFTPFPGRGKKDTSVDGGASGDQRMRSNRIETGWCVRRLSRSSTSLRLANGPV